MQPMDYWMSCHPWAKELLGSVHWFLPHMWMTVQPVYMVSEHSPSSHKKCAQPTRKNNVDNKSCFGGNSMIYISKIKLSTNQFTCKWTTHDCTATNACLKISNGKASVGMSKGYCCITLKNCEKMKVHQ